MNQIKVEHGPSKQLLDELKVFTWAIWKKEISEFPWTYDEKEVCYFLEGAVTVTTESGESVRIGKHDLVTFPKGMSCTWKIHKPIQKHYQFG